MLRCGAQASASRGAAPLPCRRLPAEQRLSNAGGLEPWAPRRLRGAEQPRSLTRQSPPATGSIAGPSRRCCFCRGCRRSCCFCRRWCRRRPLLPPLPLLAPRDAGSTTARLAPIPVRVGVGTPRLSAVAAGAPAIAAATAATSAAAAATAATSAAAIAAASASAAAVAAPATAAVTAAGASAAAWPLRIGRLGWLRRRPALAGTTGFDLPRSLARGSAGRAGPGRPDLGPRVRLAR